MKLTQTVIPEVVVIEPRVFEDDRGCFFESFNEAAFASALTALGLDLPRRFVQDNHSLSKKGVVRGLHFQAAPYAQGKLVRVVSGSAFDVAVDVRTGSPTYGQWVGVTLSAVNRKMLWIPEGFAHGFVALEEDTQFLYKATDYYNKSSERSILWNDTFIGVRWPVDLFDEITVSEKDAEALPFTNSVNY